jgi:WD40 repeat protein
MRKNFSATLLEFPRQTPDSSVNSISFDAFGNFLLASQDNAVRVYSGKSWNPHSVEVDGNKPISKCSFLPTSFGALWSSSEDETMHELNI